jgi:uncharacterized protein involved in exopolysaccharide biosynthesis
MDQPGNSAAPPLIDANSREISLGELCSILWRSKWLILGVSAAAAIIAFGITFVIPKKYNAVMVLSPVSAESASGGKLGAISQISQSLGGLGSLLGLGGSGDEQKAEAMATLQSELLTEKFIRSNDLLPILFADKWDARSKKWKTADPANNPTLWKGNVLWAKKVRGVTENSKTGMVTFTIRWGNPVLAASWANGIVKLTNDYLRDKAIARSERNIAYLTAEAAKTSEVEVRKAIFDLMQKEIENEMVSRGSDEYALKIIDPAAIPEKPAWPQPVLLTVSSAIAALILSSLVVVVRRAA